MGIFQNLSKWLADKTNLFIRGRKEEDMEMGYEEEQQEPEMEREALDPFNYGDDGYGGRVPYRSREAAEPDYAEQQALKNQKRHHAQPQYQQPQYQAQPQYQQAQYQAQPQPQYQQPQYQAQAQPQYQQPQYQAQAQYQQLQPQTGNVINFPGTQQSQDGFTYAHVEYVVLLRSRNECKDVIAYIKSNASVFLNMEFIASDSERQRCVDMLSGAAYTLGCTLNKLSPRGIYLISSPSVRVVLDSEMQKFTAVPDHQQGFGRQRQEESAQPNPFGYQHQAEPQQADEAVVAGAYTTRFQAQAAQRMPSSFGSVMAGNATGMYTPVAAAGRYQAVQQ